MNAKFKKAKWMAACSALVLLASCGGDDNGVFTSDEGAINPGFATLNTDNDGFLSAEEFNAGMQGTGDFGLFDINVDNQLTEDEFNTGISSQSDFANFDTDTSGALSELEFNAGLQGEADFGLFDTDTDNLISQQEFIIGINFIRLNNTSAFTRLDVDFDGVLDQNELFIAQQQVGTLAQLDINGDGLISAAEFNVGIENIALNNTSAFTRLDADFDGVLDQNELFIAQQQVGTLAQLDINRDGLISAAEFNAGMVDEDDGFFEDLFGEEGQGEDEGFFEDLF